MKDEKKLTPSPGTPGEGRGSGGLIGSFDAVVFGLIVADLIAEPMDLRHPPSPGGLAKLNSLQLAGGGNVCNVGIAMTKLGAKVAGAGLVGDDTLGRALIEKMQAAGMNSSAVFARSDSQTSATVVAVEPGGERCFFHTLGVTALLDAPAFEKYFDLFAQCQILQIGYFGLLPSLTRTLPAVLEKLKKRAPELRIALDTVNPPADVELLRPILQYIDIFCPSRPEAAALTGQNDPARMIAAFRQWMPTGLIGIKLDSQGCILHNGSQQISASVYPIKVVDTTGAGDTWFAGLLIGLLRNMPLEQIGRFANRAAADCCTALGASTGVRSFEETLSRI